MKNIVILTGAGISAESGIKTFRDHGGLWENHRIEDVASPEGFRRNPVLVQDFYNARRAQLQTAEVKPNDAHRALAFLEREWKAQGLGEVLVVTQNVDNLHERAGSKNLIHMHGELLKARCLKSGKVFEWKEAILPETRCTCCGISRTLRPHIVWFGEIPMELERISLALRRCEIFAAIGTSGQVYPAAGFVHEIPRIARAIEINAEESAVSDAFSEHLIGPATQRVPEWVENTLLEG